MPFRFNLGNGGEIVIGQSTDDVIAAGAGNDILFGGRGADTFSFGAGTGANRILDFTSGVDKLDFSGVSERTVSYEATDAGLLVHFGTLGGNGPDSVLLQGVASVNAGDFQFAPAIEASDYLLG